MEVHNRAKEKNAHLSNEVPCFLKGVSTSRRILNTTNIIDPSNQLSCTAYMLRNKDKPVKCQLPLPAKHELYVSGRGTIDSNCTENCTTARGQKGSSDQSNQLSCTAYMLRNKDKPVKCQLPLPAKHELYVSGRGTIDSNCTENCTTARGAQINVGFLKGVSSTSSRDTAPRRILNTTNIIDPCFLNGASTSSRILNTTNIIDPSNQLSCTAYMLRNKDKPVKCQLPLPAKHELYVSGRGTIDSNCTENCTTARV
ncbi:hypothetical protein DPMN_189428 [Dreissena polymorpha]|uniref:Uncharacterized protein n=1 Tax=Dreissena polymorpha TaxID=45954 RepID=A0A9D4DVH7_DREPO|nr:hypothetical protein DPMN_189428 [Dreissena polymorpha]